MKPASLFRNLLVLYLMAVATVACYNDTELKSDISELKGRMETIEGQMRTANGNISTLDGLVRAAEGEFSISFDVLPAEAARLIRTITVTATTSTAGPRPSERTLTARGRPLFSSVSAGARTTATTGTLSARSQTKLLLYLCLYE